MILQKLPKRLTPEFIFNHVKEHMLSMSEPCREGTRCKYRLYKSDGSIEACAVGCLIPPDRYDPKMDEGGGKNVFEICDMVKEFRPFRSLLDKLQLIHDNSSITLWGKELNQVKKEFNIDTK